MTLLGEFRRRAPHILGPVLGATLFAYFAYHAVQGDRGLIAWVKLSQKVEDARLELAEIEARRERLAHRVRLMRPDGLDPDLLDERVRATLGLVHPDDVIIVAPGTASLPLPAPDGARAGTSAAAGVRIPVRISLRR